ncbi:hypothetical protein [Pseudobacteriovorax antillogorgiicola]|uniref:Uncharacterized protein n=1 Tax=Pseudobacteriovorax antillogorgiicola TaxID=1513793 RepID=A0A1Y6BKA7_9BACT|nr:hypothetical protein [Pseudobacteriovorax antillogorgiicola]TCS54725.1 hypothetical protein EDD56_106238 [Pseudobacteriovorax antillogorgiicola]SMF15943.1 hypothetical protein SAMN06296036_1065 [Pseudobacteriovorax antillogorgiicola]
MRSLEILLLMIFVVNQGCGDTSENSNRTAPIGDKQVYEVDTDKQKAPVETRDSTEAIKPGEQNEELAVEDRNKTPEKEPSESPEPRESLEIPPSGNQYTAIYSSQNWCILADNVPENAKILGLPTCSKGSQHDAEAANRNPVTLIKVNGFWCVQGEGNNGGDALLFIPGCGGGATPDPS